MPTDISGARLPSFPKALVAPLQKRVREGLLANTVRTEHGVFEFHFLEATVTATIAHPILTRIDATQSLLLLDPPDLP